MIIAFFMTTPKDENIDNQQDLYLALEPKAIKTSQQLKLVIREKSLRWIHRKK